MFPRKFATIACRALSNNPDFGGLRTDAADIVEIGEDRQNLCLILPP